MKIKVGGLMLVISLLIVACGKGESIDSGGDGPSICITADGVQKIKNSLGTIPVFDQTLSKVIDEVDHEMALGIDVPVPKHMAGGYTHDRHKKNFLIMQKAGLLYQITGELKYATYIRDMFLKYAELFPTLGLHPVERSYARGKLFWQCLNDANWLVYASMAYDCIKETLTKKQIAVLEKDLFRPYADFLSIDNPQFFNRIHNHATWGNAAVGMIGLVMEDEDLVNRALYGMKIDQSMVGKQDNDGSVIVNSADQKMGFLAQIDDLFSPDGFYAEGPYYQRYAMFPFLVFARALENTKPEIGIFKYKNEVLKKAVQTLVGLSNESGEFFPLNDAQKGMSYYSRELVTAVDIIYHYAGHDPLLLSIAQKQGMVLLDDAGLDIAISLKKDIAEVKKETMLLKDGPQGNRGGLAVLRDDQTEVIYKYTTQGMGHGHFDKLSISVNSGSTEIIQDYGTVRYVNVEQKKGGGYLKENTTFGKQTVAHNTLVVNQTTNYNGKIKIANDTEPYLYFADVESNTFQVVCAKDTTAYPGVVMARTIAVWSDESFTNPIVLDILKVNTESINSYDLPFYYMGQLVSINMDLETMKEMKPLGKSYGYNHLWRQASGQTEAQTLQLTSLTALKDGKFFTISSTLQDDDEVILGRIGANDPNFNLRNDPYMIIRRDSSRNTVFASVIEVHGEYSPVTEIASNAYGQIKDIVVVLDNDEYTSLDIELKNGKKWNYSMSNEDADLDAEHNISVAGDNLSWTGPHLLKEYTN